MGIPSLPSVPHNATIEQLREIVASTNQTLEYLLSGYLNSDNIREVAGYNISKTDLKHKSGVVGMSGADHSNPTAVRFWAGNADPNSAPFRVQQDGTMYATDGNFTGDINGGSITGVTITGSNINVSTDVTIGNKLNMSGTNFGNGIKWGTSGIEIYIDPGAGSLRFVAPGGVYANGTLL